MNGWMGSRYMETGPSEKGYRTFVRESEIAADGPASLWVIADEHEATIDDGWFLVTMDDSQPFASAPATRHRHTYDLSFADGHAEWVREKGKYYIILRELSQDEGVGTPNVN